MEDEAYTIGIRLALDDGVSAGMAAMGAELAALDRAMAASGMGLGRLRARVVEGRTEPAPVPAEPVAEVRPAVMAPETAVMSPVVVSPEPVVAAPSVVMSPEPVAMASPAMAPAVAAVAPVLPAMAEPVAPPVVMEKTVAPAMPVVPAPAAKPAPVVRVFSPVVPPPEAPVVAPAVRAEMPAAPAPMAAMPAGVVREVERQTHVLMREPAPVVPPAVAVPDVVVGATPAASVAPGVVAAPGAAAVAPPMASAAPSAATARERAGPMQGDVFLDGARMGRWMADVLAREASRPQSGSTQFDPRMGVAWPGTLQGG